jgi:lipoprotein-anchoring transpeptidase ErfK/SrfK
MKLSWIYALSAMSATAALTLAMVPAQAQIWVGGSPVYQSEIDARAKQQEADRAARQASAGSNGVYPAFMKGGETPNIAPAKPPVVYLERDEPAGIIIVDTKGRKLYYTLPGKQAYAYPISVGRDGFTWTGTERISRIASWPSWTPPTEMRQRQKGLPVTVTGGLLNPLGAKALYLGNTIYRIHGTNNDRTIGRASSSGCFRMMNEHVTHLATLAHVGTTVRVVPNYSGVETSAPMASLFSGFSGSEPTATAVAKPPKKTKQN